MNLLRIAATTCLLAACCTASADGPAEGELLVPLSKLVHDVNSEITNTFQHPEFATSEDEIAESIEKQLPNLDLDSGLKSLLAYIAVTKRVPADARIDATASGHIFLDVVLTANTGYRLMIRHPALEREKDGTLRLKGAESKLQKVLQNRGEGAMHRPYRDHVDRPGR
jgi:hypothetical protein